MTIFAQHILHIKSTRCDIHKIAHRKDYWGGNNIILHIFELPDNNVRFYRVSCTLLNGRIQSWHIDESTW